LRSLNTPRSTTIRNSPLRLAPLRAAGVLIGIDDAGAGFSSMSHIVNMEADVIKVDISWCATSTSTRCAVPWWVLSPSLRGRQPKPLVIAEGVELEEERATLITLGWTAAQGYLSDVPRPAPVPPRP